MLLLPFEKIVYKTALTSDEITLRLSHIVGPKRLFQFKAEKPYRGRFGDQMFEIERVIQYRNSFLPKISGVMDYAPEGTTIHVNMRPAIASLIFVCFWLLSIGGYCVVSLAKVLSSHASPNIETLLPLGMFFFGYGITMASFKSESIKSRKQLRQLFEADIIKG